MKFKDWLWSIAYSVDQTINTVFGPLLNFVFKPKARFGYPDETLSSVMGKNVKQGTCRGCYIICRVLHMIDPNHCEKFIERDEGDKI